MPRYLHKSWQFWAIIVVWVASVAFGFWAWQFSARVQKFDATLWKDSSQVNKGVRFAMADDLIQSRTLHGKTRAEVVGLLGEPPPTEYFSDWDLVYWLGPERGFMSIDSEWFVIALDDDDCVTEFQIVRD